MAHLEEEEKDYTEWWKQLIAGIAFIFLAIGWVDTVTEGQNLVIRVMSLAGAVFCLGAVMYSDYRTKDYASLKKMGTSGLYSILGVGLVTAIYFLFIYDSPI